MGVWTLRAQIDYPSIGIFLNASVTPLPWWPKREGLTFEWALRPQGSMADRAHPKWWFPDVPRAALQTITRYFPALFSPAEKHHAAVHVAAQHCGGGSLHHGLF